MGHSSRMESTSMSRRTKDVTKVEMHKQSTKSAPVDQRHPRGGAANTSATSELSREVEDLIRAMSQCQFTPKVNADEKSSTSSTDPRVVITIPDLVLPVVWPAAISKWLVKSRISGVEGGADASLLSEVDDVLRILLHRQQLRPLGHSPASISHRLIPILLPALTTWIANCRPLAPQQNENFAPLTQCKIQRVCHDVPPPKTGCCKKISTPLHKSPIQKSPLKKSPVLLKRKTMAAPRGLIDLSSTRRVRVLKI